MPTTDDDATKLDDEPILHVAQHKCWGHKNLGFQVKYDFGKSFHCQKIQNLTKTPSFWKNQVH